MGLFDNATKPLQRAGSVGRFARQKGLGLVHQARSRVRGKPRDLNDVAIARKVETEIFRPPSVAKGKINVNVVDGVVFLRGEAKNPSQIKSIEANARKVPEVRDVQNLLHLPKTPARMAKRQRPAPTRS